MNQQKEENDRRNYFMINLQESIVGILTFKSMINTISESLKAKKVFIFQQLGFYEQLKFQTQLC